MKYATKISFSINLEVHHIQRYKEKDTFHISMIVHVLACTAILLNFTHVSIFGSCTAKRREPLAPV